MRYFESLIPPFLSYFLVKWYQWRSNWVRPRPSKSTDRAEKNKQLVEALLKARKGKNFSNEVGAEALKAILFLACLTFLATAYVFFRGLYRPPIQLHDWPRKYGLLAAYDLSGAVLAVGGLTITILLVRKNKVQNFPDRGKGIWILLPVIYFSFVNQVPVRILANAIYDPLVSKPNASQENLRKAFVGDRNEMQEPYIKAWAAVSVYVLASFINKKGKNHSRSEPASNKWQQR